MLHTSRSGAPAGAPASPSRPRRALGLAAVLLAFAAGCPSPRGSSEPASTEPGAAAPRSGSKTERSRPSQVPVVVLEPSGRSPVRVEVEVAQTPASRQRGLMFRRSLPELAGMIFLFEEPEHQVFWMHNTYIPLDMIFIRSDLHVLGVVENATPRTDDPRQVEGESQYVLEVNGGMARRWGVAAGTPVRLENITVPSAPAGGGALDPEETP